MRRVVRTLVFLAAVEGLFWTFGVVSIWRGNPYRLYYPSSLAAQITANLPAERNASITGWPARNAKIERDHPPLSSTRQCGSAWGGSFTFGDGVSDDHAWPYLASVKLGCEIRNIGVGGFSFDQTLLLFQEHPPQHSIAILGMARAMLRTSGVASWTFLEMDHNLPRARITKPMFTLQDGALHLQPRPEPTLAAVMQTYLSDDYGRTWMPFTFPFTLSILRALERKFTIGYPGDIDPMGTDPQAKNARKVSVAIVAAMAKAAAENDDRFVVLLIPVPDYLTDQGFVAMMHTIGTLEPSACLVDPSNELQQAGAGLAAANGHFSAKGNAVLADALVKGLAVCGIYP